MGYITAEPGWLVLDTFDGEYCRVIAWACGECLSPVVVTVTGQSGIIPMPSASHRLVYDPTQFLLLS